MILYQRRCYRSCYAVEIRATDKSNQSNGITSHNHLVKNSKTCRTVLIKQVTQLLSDEQKKKRIDDGRSILDEYDVEWDDVLDYSSLVIVVETSRNQASKWQLPGEPPPEVELSKITFEKTMITTI